jgi:hypothetical protein
MTAKIAAGSWVPTKAACEQLHISRFTLLRLKNTYCRLEAGTHWIRISPTSTAPILWNVEKIRDLMAGWSTVAGDQRNQVSDPCYEKGVD